MGELIPIGIHKPQEGGTTIINENGVDYGDEIEALKNAQGIKTAPTGKIFVDWTGVGYEYEVTYPLYYINGQAFPAGSTKIPLDGSHETLDRIDTFGLNANGVFVNKGTPAAEPLAPTVDEANEIYITTRDVKANTTEPEQDTIPVSNIDVYKENQEWTGSVVSGGTTNFNNTSKTFEGAKSIRVSGSFQLKDTSNTHNRNSFGALRLKVMSSSQSYIAFSFQFLMNNTVISSTETVTAGIDYPNWKNPATYETVLVDFEKFNFTADEFNTILIMPIKGAKFTGSTFIDNISLVANSVNVVTSTGNSTIDTSEFVSKHSFHFSPFDLSGVVVDLDVSTRSGSAYAIQGTVTELHSLHNSNLIPKFFYGQDFYIKNDQATPFVIKNKSGVVEQQRFIFSFPNDEDISIQPKEIFHFKNMMTEYNGGTLEFVGKRVDLGNLIANAEEKVTIHDEDKVGLADYEESDKTKFWKWSTIKTTLYNYFKNLFQVKDTQILVGSSMNVQDAWSGQTIYFTANCTITVPATLGSDFKEFGFRTMTGVTVTWAITAPFTWETTPATTPEKTDGLFTRYNAGNTILLRW